MSNWKEIWDKKDRVQKYILECMVKSDGFDSLGTFQVQNWLDYCETLYSKLGVREGVSVFEAGCGSGAFLYPLFLKGNTVGGLDYCEQLVNMAGSFMPGFHFLCADAEELDTDKKFDVVVSHSLFHYFQDYDKARTVLEKMIFKSNKVIGVFDVCDEEMKAEYHKERIENFVKEGFTEAQYWEKYQNLDHLFYSRSFFESVANEFGLHLEFSPQTDPNYGNSRLRYNVTFRKSA